MKFNLFLLKINDEHYIFSVFGVLHIVPNEENDNMTLDEWNREAVLWEACRKIKFFKKFLKNKFFYRYFLSIYILNLFLNLINFKNIDGETIRSLRDL